MEKGEINVHMTRPGNKGSEFNQAELVRNIEIVKQVIDHLPSEESFTVIGLTSALAKKGQICGNGYTIKLLNELIRQGYIKVVQGARAKYKKAWTK